MVQLSQRPNTELPSETHYLKFVEIKMFFFKSVTLSDHVCKQPEVAAQQHLSAAGNKTAMKVLWCSQAAEWGITSVCLLS